MSRQIILHVEDDDNDALLFRIAARRAQLDVVVHRVMDGEAALHYLAAHASSAERVPPPFPDLVLLDLKLPLLDGFSVLEVIRSRPETAHLPVYILTSSNLPEDVQMASALGADAYFVKGPAFEEAVQAIQSRCQVPVES